MRYCSFLVALLVAAAIVGVSTAHAHKYADGFVERSLTITIREHRAYGEYAIGLNAKTADKILNDLKAAHRVDAPDNKHPNESTRKPPLRDGQQIEQPKSDPIEGRGPTLDVPRAPIASNKNAPQESEDERPEPGVGEHLTDANTIKEFEQLAKEWFTKHLSISIDGQLVEIEKITVSPLARHPYSMTVKFEFDLDVSQQPAKNGPPVDGQPTAPPNSQKAAKTRLVSLTLQDNTFASLDGAIRYAMRAKGSTLINRSNVAPVLARAERQELAKLDEKAKTALRQIKAQIVLVKVPSNR